MEQSKVYKFARTYTDVYFFEVIAKSAQDADEKFANMDKEDAEGMKNLDIVSELEEVVEIENEQDNTI